jgi:hypothetical protein
MNGYYSQLYKLSRQIQHVTPDLPIYNPYRRLIERAATKYHPTLKKLFYELLHGIARLHHIHHSKKQLMVSREDVVITLSLMKQLLLPEKEKTVSDSSIDTYILLMQVYGQSQAPFSVIDVCIHTKHSLSTVKRHLRNLADYNYLERITDKKRYYYKVNPR